MIAVLPLLFLLQAPAGELPRAVVAAATRAVEGDSAEPLRRRWTRQLGRGDPAALLGLATLARLTFRYQTSDSLYTLLISAAPQAGSEGYRRYALLGLGEGYATRGLPRLAAARFARADSLAGPDAAVRIRALLGLAEALGRTQEDAAHDSIIALIGGLPGETDPLLAGEYHCARAGPPLLPGEADEITEASIGARLAHLAGDRRLEARCLLGVAKGHYRARRTDSALAVSAAGIRLAEAARDSAGLAALHQWRGYARLTAGDYGGAWHELHEALDLAQRTGSQGHGGLAAMYLSSLALRFGDPDLALARATLAESLLTRTGNQRTVGSVRAIRADIARALGDTARARQMYLELLAGGGRFGGFGAVAPYRSLATMARQRGAWAEAESLLAAAQREARAQGMQEWDDRLWYDRGAVALARGEDRAARSAFLRFLGTLSPAQQARGYAARVRLAELAARRGDLAGAEQWLVAAADSLDALRSRIDVPALRLMTFQIRDDDADPDLGFATTIAALAAGGREAAALQLAERRRARELADQLMRGIALRRRGDDSTRPLQLPPVSLDDLRDQLGPGLALLSYVTGQGNEPTTLFLVRPGRIAAFRLPPIDSLEPLLYEFTTALERGDTAPARAAELGRTLLRPALDSLPPSVTGLVIVPDAGLYGVPFDALTLAGRAVVDRFVTSLLPSATLLVRLRRLPPRPGNGVLAFGDPRRSARDTAAIGALLADLGSLAPLPSARREAREVAGYSPDGVALVGAAATEEAFRRLGPHRRVLHFAVHAVVSRQALTRTALLLAPSPDDDGLLLPGEIAALQLDADLVVLSACRTTAGVTLAGEGVRGLVAPFLESGARAVIGNAWEVGDAGAREMMRRLYDGLALGLPVGQALQRARRQAREAGVSPTLWAGFTLTGDPEVRIPLRRPPPTLAWSILVLLLLAGGGWWFGLRRRPRPPNEAYPRRSPG